MHAVRLTVRVLPVQADIVLRANQGADVHDVSTSYLNPSLVQRVYNNPAQQSTSPSRCAVLCRLLWVLPVIARNQDEGQPRYPGGSLCLHPFVRACVSARVCM